MSMMNRCKVNKNHVSKVDAFLYHFDQKNSKKSQSQQKEIDEYKHLFYQRDTKIKTKH